jgi:hypothetical protein
MGKVKKRYKEEASVVKMFVEANNNDHPMGEKRRQE